MNKRKRLRVSYVQTLIYYDEPRLILLQNTKGSPVIAYPLDEQVEGYDEPYIAKLTTNNIFSSYMDQKIDLAYVFDSYRGGLPYIFDGAGSWTDILIDPIEDVLADYESALPDRGVFSRNHTEALVGTKVAAMVRYQYLIDGKWSAGDFSRFYAKLSDLYSIFSYVEEMKRAGGQLTQHLSSVIASYPWQGGGSYLNFFRDITATAVEDYPLQVSRIQYASPGQIEVKGIPESLQHIDRVIVVFDERRDELKTTYQSLRGVLQRDDLLTSDQRDFSNEASAKLATREADNLLTGMEIRDTAAIKQACRNHLVTYAKIALAIFRRGEELHRFHLEGRMQVPSRQ